MLDLHTELRRVQTQLRTPEIAPLEFDFTNFQRGSAGCIAGWITSNHDGDIGDLGVISLIQAFPPENAEKLRDLFGVSNNWDCGVDDRTGTPMDEVTPEHAATAIENLLTRGDPHWEEVLA